jgi:hypothetical protein
MALLAFATGDTKNGMTDPTGQTWPSMARKKSQKRN